VQRVVIVDVGSGNLRSVERALRHVAGDAAQVLVSARAEELRSADRVVFPGQGAMAAGLRGLAADGLGEALREQLRRRPFLGLCLGLQALMQHSEEDDGTPCLGVLSGEVRRFPAGDAACKVPHMGWNQVAPVRPHPLFAGIPAGSYFYFVHSYYVAMGAEGAAATTCHGLTFVSAVARRNLFATQFHPEKSQQAGLRLLENFLHWDGDG